MKYTDEQLSRILSAAAVGGLEYTSPFEVGVSWGNGCVEQVARCVSLPGQNKRTNWFDDEGKRNNGDPDAILRALEVKGWA